jgi:hypothetical protein
MSGDIGDVPIVDDDGSGPSDGNHGGVVGAGGGDYVAEFLSAWANGRAQGQNAAFLDRILKTRVEDRVAKLRPKRSRGPVEIGEKEKVRFIEAWVTALVGGVGWACNGEYASIARTIDDWASTRTTPQPTEAAKAQACVLFLRNWQAGAKPSTIYREAYEILNGIVQAQVEAARESVVEGVAPDLGPAETLMEEVRELTAKVEDLETELDRAHEWRFHLESRAREVYNTVRRLLTVAKRAPTEVEMTNIVATLKEAIGWSP